MSTQSLSGHFVLLTLIKFAFSFLFLRAKLLTVIVLFLMIRYLFCYILIIFLLSQPKETLAELNKLFINCSLP